MTRLYLLTIWFLAGAAVWAQTSVSANGWTVTADSQNRIVSIAYVLQAVHLNIATDRSFALDHRSRLGWGRTEALRGRSDTVPGDAYSLWFHLPRNVRVARVHAMSGQIEIPAVTRVKGESLMLSFTSPQKRLDWEVSFSGR